MSKYFTIFNTRSESENHVIEERPWVGVILDERVAVFSAEEKIEVDVWLISHEPDKKISVVKEVNAITGLGLSGSLAVVEGCPRCIKEGVSIEEGTLIAEQLRAAGAIVELR